MHTQTLRPSVILSHFEHRELLALAARGGGALASAAESLMDELERARVVPDAKLPADIVRMGSQVQYRTDRDEIVDVTLVYPQEADIALGRVSVLTPVGAALIGLRTGQSITRKSRDGRKHVLTVTSVIQPGIAPADA